MSVLAKRLVFGPRFAFSGHREGHLAFFRVEPSRASGPSENSMNRISVIAIWFLSVSLVWAQDETGVLPDSDVEPLLRGPVHEAFAEPVQLNPQEMLTVPKLPPALVEEVPPDARPAGEDVNWIPGYWAWDDEREDFIWVSGIYRRTPLGRSWQPGQWEQVAEGYRWLPGRWIPIAGGGELLPTPPESLEEGPQGEPVSEDHFWVPGSWQYRNQRYVWRPGFWSACHNNWVWVPDYYVAGVNGCHFVPGYWDYGWEHRGTIFAPCRFRRSHVGFRYCPSVVIDFAGAFTHLWVRPRYCHYYFGDYYDNRYGSWGIQPWYRYHHHHRRAYDPLYVHYKWRYKHHHGIGLHKHLHNRHVHYRDGKHRRPDRKYRDYAARDKHHDADVLAHRVKDRRKVEERRKKTGRDVLQVRTEAQKQRFRDEPEGRANDVRRAIAENQKKGNRAAENRLERNRAAGNRTAENRSERNRAAGNRTAENRPEGNRAAGNRTAENRPEGNRAAGTRRAENRAIENRVAGNRRAENRLDVDRNDPDRRNRGRQVAGEQRSGQEAEGRSRSRSMAEVIRDARNQQASPESPAGNQAGVTDPINPLRNQVVRERTAPSQGRVQPGERSSRQTDSAANRSSQSANRNAGNSGRVRSTGARQNGSSSVSIAGQSSPAESVNSKLKQRTRTRANVKPTTQTPPNRVSQESSKSSPRSRFENRTEQTRNRVITAKPVTQPRSDKPTSRANNPSASRSQTSRSPVTQATAPRTSNNRTSSSRASSPQSSVNRSSSSRGGSPPSKLNRSSSSRASSSRSSINRSSSSRASSSSINRSPSSRASSSRSSINRSSSSRGGSPRSNMSRSSGSRSSASRGGKSRP